MAHGHTDMRDGATSRPSYPAGRKPAKRRRNFNWKGTELGRRGLVVIYLSAIERASDEQLCQKKQYAKHGITKEYIYNKLVQYLPELLEFYKECMGKEMPLHLPMQRLYKMYLQHRGPGLGCDHVYSTEHPLRQKWGRALIEEMQEKIDRNNRILKR